MMTGTTFGPSSRRTVHVSEQHSASVRWWRRSPPPVIGALVFTAAFIGILSGYMLTYDDQEMLGIAVIGVTVVVCALLVVWGIKVSR
ncbi:MAG: hypothetical protein JSU93_05095 [Methanobacteriota archaeon]|nr:MAG: hypothetical protein JSU93_05095 [Euryarchaeota archaeon]